MTIIICSLCLTAVASSLQTGTVYCKCKQCAVTNTRGIITIEAPGTDYFTVMEHLPETEETVEKPKEKKNVSNRTK